MKVLLNLQILSSISSKPFESLQNPLIYTETLRNLLLISKGWIFSLVTNLFRLKNCGLKSAQPLKHISGKSNLIEAWNHFENTLSKPTNTSQFYCFANFKFPTTWKNYFTGLKLLK
jgi:hypothetical protein